MDMPPVRYTRAEDGVAIAYTVAGSGPVLLIPPGWVIHLEQTWASGARLQAAEFAEYFTVVHYDKRGTGLSDRDVEDISLEAQLLDLEAVVAAIDSPRLAIFAGSGGGPPSLLFTASNPERVICLALYGSYAAGPSARGEEPDYMYAVIKANWGVATRAFADRFMPGVDATRSMIEAYAESQRVSASAEVAALIWETREHLDVREHLANIVVPTLVVHLTGDLVVPIRTRARDRVADSGSGVHAARRREPPPCNSRGRSPHHGRDSAVPAGTHARRGACR
jgi:pimeloyl-ACP methyl ester carboxylesterase